MPYNLTKTKYLRRQHDVVAYRFEVYASGAHSLLFLKMIEGMLENKLVSLNSMLKTLTDI